MKFSIQAVVFALFVATSSAATLGSSKAALRKKRGQDDGGDGGSSSNKSSGMYVEAFITIEHVGIPEDGILGRGHGHTDEGAVVDALIKADSIVNPGSDYQAESGFVSKAYIVPDNVDDFCHNGNKNMKNGLKDYQWSGSMFSLTFIYWGCSRFGCSSDDDFMLTDGEGGGANTNQALFFQIVGKGGPKHHRALEAEFCKNLRESGAPEYQDITTCTIDFIYTDRDDEDMAALLEKRAATVAGPKSLGLVVVSLE